MVAPALFFGEDMYFSMGGDQELLEFPTEEINTYVALCLNSKSDAVLLLRAFFQKGKGLGKYPNPRLEVLDRLSKHPTGSSAFTILYRIFISRLASPYFYFIHSCMRMALSRIKYPIFPYKPNRKFGDTFSNYFTNVSLESGHVAYSDLNRH